MQSDGDRVQWKFYDEENTVLKSGSLGLKAEEEVEFFETLYFDEGEHAGKKPQRAEFTLVRDAGVAAVGGAGGGGHLIGLKVLRDVQSFFHLHCILSC